MTTPSNEQSLEVLLERVKAATGPKPSIKTSFHCQGCPALVTEDWEFHEEDDGIDRGIDAKCTAVTPHKHIASYWHSHDRAPDWCPALTALKGASE